MNKITPFLWFDNNVDEALDFYTSIFTNSKVIHKTPGEGGKTQWAELELEGQELLLLDGGPEYHFTEAFSLFVQCAGQEEVDQYWNALTTNGGSEGQCGWLKDKFGLSWQIIPKQFSEMMAGDDEEKVGRMMQAMFKMKKLDIAELKKAYDGK